MADQPGDEVRVSDAERNRMVEMLRGHCADGRLTLDEFSERVGEVYAAKTRADLELSRRDLPVPATTMPVPAGPRREPVRWTVGIMSGSVRKGRWRVGEQTGAIAIMGGAVLDLRGAEIDGPEVVITAVAIMGGVEIIVPEGIEVDLTGFNLMGAKECRISELRLPGTPLVRVEAFVLMGSVVVRNKKPRGTKSGDVIDVTSGSSRHKGNHGWHDERHDARDHMRSERERVRTDMRRERDRIREELRRERDKWREWVLGWDDAAPARSPDVRPEVQQEVREDKERLRNHAAPDGTVTILFSDIEGSTAMVERLGDQRWVEILRAHRTIVREQVEEHKGYEVSSAGDGFMLAFSSARRALQCAIGIQQATARYNAEHTDEPLRVRIGLHVGETIKEAGDFLGKAVHFAARIADQADGGEILVSSLVKELTDSAGDIAFENGRDVELRGLSGAGRVYSVVWQ
jgi:class 3 adenylate cyclase